MSGFHLKTKNQDKQRERAERFEVAFNKIHNQLKKLANNDDKFFREDRFSTLVHTVKDRHPSIRMYKDDLLSYARLRNAIVHEKMRKNYFIADPHGEVVKNIEKIAQFLLEPPKATTIASKPVKAYETTDDLKTVLIDMGKCPFTQYPVYEDGKFSFLLTESGITSFLADQFVDNLIDFSNETVLSIKPYECYHAVTFVSRSYDVFQIEDLFEKSLQEKRKLEAVIVTENGRETEKPLGIITAWDLIKVERNL